MRVCLRTSECYLTVAGDRRAVHALKKYQESVLRVELRMTAVTAAPAAVLPAGAAPQAGMGGVGAPITQVIDPASTAGINMKRKLEQVRRVRVRVRVGVRVRVAQARAGSG